MESRMSLWHGKERCEEAIWYMESLGILQKHVKFYDVCEQKVLSAKIILSDVRTYDAATPRAGTLA